MRCCILCEGKAETANSMWAQHHRLDNNTQYSAPPFTTYIIPSYHQREVCLLQSTMNIAAMNIISIPECHHTQTQTASHTKHAVLQRYIYTFIRSLQKVIWTMWCDLSHTWCIQEAIYQIRQCSGGWWDQVRLVCSHVRLRPGLCIHIKGSG